MRIRTLIHTRNSEGARVGTTNTGMRRRLRTAISLAAAMLTGLAFGGLSAQSAAAQSASGRPATTATPTAVAASHQAPTKHLCAAPGHRARRRASPWSAPTSPACGPTPLSPAATPVRVRPDRPAVGVQAHRAPAAPRETVAIVDAYDDPNAESDLAAYRSQYGLAACTTANGCFRKVNQNGGTSYPAGERRLGRGDLAGPGHGLRHRARARTSCWSRPTRRA